VLFRSCGSHTTQKTRPENHKNQKSFENRKK